MRSKCCKTLILGWVIAYLAILTLGHLFHNHGPFDEHGPEACCSECACSHPHHHAGAHAGGMVKLDTCESDPGGHVHGDHCCPICHFFAIHGVSGEAGETAEAVLLRETVNLRPPPILLAACRGPQQPRAPPMLL